MTHQDPLRQFRTKHAIRRLGPPSQTNPKPAMKRLGPSGYLSPYSSTQAKACSDSQALLRSKSTTRRRSGAPSNWTLVALLCSFILLSPSVSAKTFAAKTFTDAGVINFVDALTTGFRVILSDAFLRQRVNPLSLSTLYVSAVPLRDGEPRFTTVLYPDVVYADKQVAVKGLREKSWYYVCVEWESYGRHNETMGCNCRLYRTLDRFAKAAASVVSDVQIAPSASSSTSLDFRLSVDADFPLRLTAYLSTADGAATAAAQTFFTRRAARLDVRFATLAADTDYGRLCVVEEPARPAGYTAMGRLIKTELKERCYFKALRTKPSPAYRVSDRADDGGAPARAYPIVSGLNAAARSREACSCRMLAGLVATVFLLCTT